MPPFPHQQEHHDALMTPESSAPASTERSRTIFTSDSFPRNDLVGSLQEGTVRPAVFTRNSPPSIANNSSTMAVPATRYIQPDLSRPSYSGLPVRSARITLPSHSQYHEQERHQQQQHQQHPRPVSQPPWPLIYPPSTQSIPPPYNGVAMSSQNSHDPVLSELARAFMTQVPDVCFAHGPMSFQSPCTCRVGMGSHQDYLVSEGGYESSLNDMHVSHSSTAMSSMADGFALAGYEIESRVPSQAILHDMALQRHAGLIPSQIPTLPHGEFGMSPMPHMPMEQYSHQHGYIGPPHYSNGSINLGYHHVPSDHSNEEYAFVQSSLMPHPDSWNALDTGPGSDTRSGSFAFQSSPEEGFDMCLSDQELNDELGPNFTPQTGISPRADERELEGWQPVEVPSVPCSSVESPFELIESPRQTPSPRNQQPSEHQPILTLPSGVTKPSSKALRGRQRRLTPKEKQEARQVREAKACWACHLCKIKCSPCSQGSPCKRCNELEGKRRFCRLPCFNDPLESFCGFFTPDYLTGHFTKANVEHFVTTNATAWGTKEMTIRMSWGYWNPLEAKVFALEICRDSQMGVHHPATWGPDGTTVVKKPSPPLGIPLAAMDSLQDQYDVLVHKIVHDDLVKYVEVAYDDQESDLPGRLLQSLATYYNASKVAGDECDLLGQALDIHVINTIIDRSLVLDDESRTTVEGQLRTKLPERSAARCVQRQVKLAFFLVQRQRIQKVLETLGSLMWTNSKGPSSDTRWATRFSVFLALVLIMDQTLTRGNLFSRTRIRFHDAELAREARIFEEHKLITQVHLFERFKEIFHTYFKSRKNGKEACNPVRDGLAAFKGQRVSRPVEVFVGELRGVVGEFEQEIRSERFTSSPPSGEGLEGLVPYVNAGRLASLFLADFLG